VLEEELEEELELVAVDAPFFALVLRAGAVSCAALACS
jgi:hypothetical protein